MRSPHERLLALHLLRPSPRAVRARGVHHLLCGFAQVSAPLAIDLCCGLCEPEFGLRANAAVEQLVARWAKHPEHVPLRVADERPGAVAGKFRLVRDLQDAILAAAFARRGNVRVSAAHPVELGVLIGSARVVFPLPRRIAPRPNASKLACGFPRAIRRAVTLIGAGRDNLKMSAAARAVFSRRRHVGLFTPAAATGPSRAAGGAIEFVRPYGLERCGAITTGQIIHSGAIA